MLQLTLLTAKGMSRLSRNTIVAADEPELIFCLKKLYAKHLLHRRFEVTEKTKLTLHEFWMEHYNIVIRLKVIDMEW